MPDEKSSSSSIKFGRSSTMALTESGWRISIKNADGTSDEVTIEPKLLEAGDDEDASNVSVNPYPYIRSTRFLQILNVSLTISPTFCSPRNPLQPSNSTSLSSISSTQPWQSASSPSWPSLSQSSMQPNTSPERGLKIQ
jgi:hypothetical protein